MFRIMRLVVVLLIADSNFVKLNVLARGFGCTCDSTGILKDYVITNSPGTILQRNYPNCDAWEGNVMTLTGIDERPSLYWNSALSKFYTLMAMEGIMSPVAQAFVSSNIVPDVVSEPPKNIINLSYDSGVTANLGNELTPTQVKHQPCVSYEAKPADYYFIILTDPDNYNGTDLVYREWRHWMVGNIPGCDVSNGDVIAAYIGSGPPAGTGLHRYVFIVFKQPGKLVFDETRLTNTSVDGRAGFSTKKFAEKYNLGNPVAGNFYRAQYDDYVPVLYKGLGVTI